MDRDVFDIVGAAIPIGGAKNMPMDHFLASLEMIASSGEVNPEIVNALHKAHQVYGYLAREFNAITYSDVLNAVSQRRIEPDLISAMIHDKSFLHSMLPTIREAYPEFDGLIKQVYRLKA